MIRGVAILCVGLAASAFVAGCGDDDDDDVSSAKEEYCQAVSDVAEQAAAVQGLNAGSTVEDAQSAVDDLQSAVDAAESAADEVGSAEVEALQSSYAALQSSLQDISGSDTLAEALPQVVAARDTFLTQWDAISSRNCGGALVSTTTAAS